VPFPRVAVVDTETTGLHPWAVRDDGGPTGDPHGPDRLCSLAARLLDRGADGRWREVGHALWLFDPGRPIPEAASRVNGFCRSDEGEGGKLNLAGMPLFRDCARAVLSFVADRALVCHNVAFDVAALDAELARAALALLDAPLLCTKKAFSDSLGLGRPHAYVPGTNLNRLSDALGVDRSGRVGPDGSELHGALVDAGMAAECFQALDALGWMVAEDAAGLPHRRA
jgi:DNA polymerase-3 subunit epsilon